MEKEDMKIVFVGHIDHGKSTLIGRLLYDTDSLPEEKYEDIKYEAERTGKDIEFAFVMDHLKEEREKGITIDTAQTFFQTEKRNYVIIDAPGHKEFIKNMITGASQAETAILMLDVDEGVMDQTKRHAYILSLLGIEQVIVAMNKMDKVSYDEERFEKVKEDLMLVMDNMGIEPKFVIPVSAKKGDNIAKKSPNMGWYSGKTILEALDEFKVSAVSTEKPLRLPVQDSYNFDGEDIVVGRIESGKIKRGQEITLLPEKESVEVKKIKKFNEEPEEAFVGESVGVVLGKKLERGQIIVDENIPRKTDIVDAQLFWLSPEKIKKGENLTFKSTTQEVPCTIEKIKKRIDSSDLKIIEENGEELNEHEIGEVLIKLQNPVFIDDFNEIKETGRFVLEKNDSISGGGIITEV